MEKVFRYLPLLFDAIAVVFIFSLGFFIAAFGWSSSALDEKDWTLVEEKVTEFSCVHLAKNYHWLKIRIYDQKYEKKYFFDRPGCEYIKNHISPNRSTVRIQHYENWIFHLESDGAVIFSGQNEINHAKYSRMAYLFLAIVGLSYLVIRYFFYEKFMCFYNRLTKRKKRTSN